MSYSSIHLTSREDLERLCDVAGRLSLPQLPLFRASADGLLALVGIYNPAGAWPSALIERNANRPTCVLIGADPGVEHPDPPPVAWACARRLKYWQPRAVVIHGAGGEADHYREAATATVLAGRLAFVETTSARALEWVEFLRCPHTAVWLPSDGVHPVPAAREWMQ
jgi:hypothetical protein